MDDMINDLRFRPRPRRDVITANNAFIEEINNRAGLVTISYGVLGDFDMINIEVVRLVVDDNTVIQDQFGQPLTIRDLREGMTVDAVFSAAMTRSIPPQARAFRITVIASQETTSITEGRVMEVDPRSGFLYTGDPFDIYSQMRFVITDATTIRDRRGNRLRLRDLRPGDFVVIEHANFQTMSIPPQTTAFDVLVL